MNTPSLPAPPVNRSAVISLLAGVATVLSFCTAVAPIPFTGYVCYPGAVIFGLVAVVTGVRALVQIRTSQEDGRTSAIIGIWIGAIALVGALCAIALGIVLFPKFVAFMQEGVRLVQATGQRIVEFFSSLR